MQPLLRKGDFSEKTMDSIYRTWTPQFNFSVSMSKTQNNPIRDWWAPDPNQTRLSIQLVSSLYGPL